MLDLFEYKNFYYCQWHHESCFLSKNGWWYDKGVWGEDNTDYGSYWDGDGDELSEKYDENLIFSLW